MAMNLFPNNCTYTSYKYPIIKLTAFLLIIVSALCISCCIHYSNWIIRVLVKIVAFAMVLFGFLGVYSSLGEMWDVYFNRKNAKHRTSNAKPFPIDTVLRIVKENDIIELEVYDQKRTITIGTSAMSTYTSKTFWDKRFYIEDQEYEKIEDFSQALLQLFPDGVVPVFTIDGLNPKHTVYGRPFKS